MHPAQASRCHVEAHGKSGCNGMNTQSRLEPENEVSPPGDVAALDRSPERAQRPWQKPLAFAIVPALVVLAGVNMWLAQSGLVSSVNARSEERRSGKECVGHGRY